MLYRTLCRMIERGQTEGLMERIDVFFAVGKLAEEEYRRLVELLGTNTKGGDTDDHVRE